MVYCHYYALQVHIYETCCNAPVQKEDVVVVVNLLIIQQDELRSLCTVLQSYSIFYAVILYYSVNY